jgi:ATP-dependent helicase/nuclease subunit B
MPITRHFLGWDGPALQRAGVYLHEQLGQGEGGWDLAHVVAVVPARRAGRRLIEVLVTQAQDQGHALSPPRVVTAGGLPELLYQPGKLVAGDLDAQLAWVAALRGMPTDQLVDLLPHPPGEDDLPGWWALAKQLRSLDDDLAGHMMRFKDVPRLCAERGFDLRGEERWDVLERVGEAYREVLASQNLADRNSARRDAIRQECCALLDNDTRIVLIATPDMNDVVAAMLGQVADRVTALVMAPDEHSGGFDGLGLLKCAYWEDQSVEIQPEQICFVERVSNQPGELLAQVMAARDRARAEGETLSADRVTVGLGDEKFSEAVMRSLDLAGIPSRQAAGTSADRSRPAVLLRALGGFMEQQRHDALARLLRHTDMEAYLQSEQPGGEDARAVIEDWLTLLDQYATRHLQGRLTGAWLGRSDRQEKLKGLRDRVIGLLPVHPSERRALSDWSGPIADVLKKVYADVFLDEREPDDRRLGQSLELIAGLLREQAELDDKIDSCPELTAAQAISLTLDRLSELTLADEGGEPAVELLGYLELALDDAPVLMVAGMNEGLIPTSRNADAFLPDMARSALTMHDNAHRYGRDLMLLNAITHSRPTVRLIAARRSDEGDPLTLSRLLLACGEGELVERVRSYFGEGGGDAAPPLLPLVCGGVDGFLIPRPTVDPEPIGELRVTAFRQYLACPYRFYLRYVLGLNTLDDRAVEMDPMSFGTLAHEVLQSFGQGDVRHEADPREIGKFLDDRLDGLVGRRFGNEPRSAVRIQVEQLRQRFETFADVQSGLVQSGWRIEHVEKDLRAEVLVDGEVFWITGKVDRIDRHETLGWRIYDYKTGDTAKPPEKTHRAGPKDDKTWIDLQLPLYRDLCATLGVTGVVELGYLNLPKSAQGAGPAIAEWGEDELAQAVIARDEVIVSLREQRFWPPSDAPKYPDGLGRVCADAVMQRRSVIAASGGEGER